jgi:hypothetical protein
MAEEKLVEGWTDPINQQLLNDGAAVNITGCTIALLLYDKAGVLITLTGTTSIVDAATGKVRFSPGSSDLTVARSPIKARWRVTDSSSKVSFFPNDPPDVWTVRKP